MLARPVVGYQLARLDASAQLLEPAAPEERGTPPAADLRVVEDRETELGADSVRERARRRDRSLHVLGREGDERDDIGNPDARMDTDVLA